MDLLVLSFFLAKVMYFLDTGNNEWILFWIFIMVFVHSIFWYLRKDCKLQISKAYHINNGILYFSFFILWVILFAWFAWFPLWEGDIFFSPLFDIFAFWIFYIPIGLIVRYYFLYKKREKIGNMKKVFLAFLSELFLFNK